MSKKSIFKQVDEAIFKVVDQLKTQSAYQSLQEMIGKLAEREQKIVNLSLSYLLLALPILVTLIVWTMNSSLRSTIEDKRAILSEIQEFNDKRAQSDQKGRAVIVPSPIAAQSELQSKIVTLLGRINIPTTSVQVRSFNEGRNAGELKEFGAELVFDKLSSKQFFDMVQNLNERERIRVKGLLVENRIDQSVLKGRMTLSFLTQVQQ